MARYRCTCSMATSLNLFFTTLLRVGQRVITTLGRVCVSGLDRIRMSSARKFSHANAASGAAIEVQGKQFMEGRLQGRDGERNRPHCERSTHHGVPDCLPSFRLST